MTIKERWKQYRLRRRLRKMILDPDWKISQVDYIGLIIITPRFPPLLVYRENGRTLLAEPEIAREIIKDFKKHVEGQR